MAKEYRSNFGQQPKRFLVVLVIIAVAILLVVSIIWSSLTESTYTILRDKVLVNKKFLKDAKIINQQKDEQGRDVYLSLHAILTAAATKEMSQQDGIIKECAGHNNLHNCTNPTWIDYDAALKTYPLATPTISGETSGVVKCTSYWVNLTADGSPNSQDIICLNSSNGELWYVFSKI